MSERAIALRRHFDASFAEPRRGEERAGETLLGIVVGGDRHALRLADVGGVFADRVVTRMPARAPGLLGITSVRGAIVPVFDLAVVLGYPPAADPPRWCVLAAGAPVAFAFAELVTQLRGDGDLRTWPVIDLKAATRAVAKER